MSETENDQSEATRLERLWSGAFGDEYVDRNIGAYEKRAPFWRGLLEAHPCERVLEVGCNVGRNLRCIAGPVDPSGVYGVDINHKALFLLRRELPSVNTVWSPARTLPFRDNWFDLVFTTGVLIHQPDSTLPLVISEMVRCSRHWVLAGEYFSAEPTEVHYRGHSGALFKRDYATIIGELFPELSLVEQGFLERDQGWDDVTWWLFRKG